MLILPTSAAVGVGPLASGPLAARLGPKPPMLAGLGFATAGAALLAVASTPATSLALVVAGSVLLGIC